MMIIEMCEANEMALYAGELEAEGMDVVTYSCLDRCAACVLRAYAYVNGELVEADRAAEVLAQIRRRKESEEGEEVW